MHYFDLSNLLYLCLITFIVAKVESKLKKKQKVNALKNIYSRKLVDKFEVMSSRMNPVEERKERKISELRKDSVWALLGNPGKSLDDSRNAAKTKSRANINKLNSPQTRYGVEDVGKHNKKMQSEAKRNLEHNMPYDGKNLNEPTTPGKNLILTKQARLSDLQRAIVMAEILCKPRAYRKNIRA